MHNFNDIKIKYNFFKEIMLHQKAAKSVEKKANKLCHFE